MITEKNLCVVTGNLIVAKEVFVDGGAEKLLEPLREKLKEFVPDITTAKGRKEIASFAAKFSKSKTLVDGIGKELKDEYSVIIKPIDKERKIFRDGCDEMKVEARQALTTWEDEQKRLEEIERQKVILELEAEETARLKVIGDREKELERREAEIQKIEDDRIAKEQAEQAEKDRIAYEAKVKADAELKAKKDSEDALIREQQEKERLILLAENKEKQRLQDIEDAEAKRLADLDFQRVQSQIAQQKALDQQRYEQEEKERIERERIESERLIAERKAKHLGHQKAVNNRILAKILPFCSSKDSAMKLIEDIIKNPTNDIKINY